MSSIPQLRKDINDLQLKLSAAESELAELKSAPPRVIVKTEVVTVEGKEKIIYIDKPSTVYVDNPALIDTIRKLQEKVRENGNLL